MSIKFEDVASPDDAYDAVMLGVDFLISRYLRTMASEQRHPSGDADGSDDTIKDCKESAAKLRIIREQFENIFHGVV